MNNLPFSSHAEAFDCVRTRLNLDPSAPKLRFIPYSRYSITDSTLLWLSKDTAKPNFKFGKLVLGKPDRFDPSVDSVCGLHIERGCKQSLESSYKLARDWKWHEVVNAMSNTLPVAIGHARLIVEHDISVYLYAGIEGAKKIDRLRFESSGMPLKVNGTGSMLELGLLSGASTCTSWSDFHNYLQHLPTSLDWHWVDLFVVAPFSLEAGGPDHTTKCIEMMKCFLPYVGKGRS